VHSDSSNSLLLADSLQLGVGVSDITNRQTPTPVFGLSQGIVVISLGNAHSCAIDTIQDLYCWGRNENGQVLYECWDFACHVIVFV